MMLALLDVMDGDHVRQSFPIAAGPDGTAQLRIGRALDCDVCLDDPHLAGEHALLAIGPETVSQLTLLPSLNGAQQGRRRYAAGEQLAWPTDGLVQMGHTRLRLRHAAAALAPERPLLQAPRSMGLVLLGLAALVLAAWDTWLGLEPGANWLAFGGPVLALASALLVWSGLWSLVTQLFQRRFPFFAHLRRALVYLIVIQLGGTLLPALGFMFSAPWLLVPAKLWVPLASVGLVYWHAREVWPKPTARFVLKAFLTGGVLMWLAMGWTRQESLQHRWREPYLSTVLPPQLRVAPLRSVDALMQDASALRGALSEKAKVDAEGNEIDDED